MSKDKQERHAHEHEELPGLERDVGEDSEIALDEETIRADNKPFGPPENPKTKDIPGYIVNAEKEGRKTRITITKVNGTIHEKTPWKVGMTGYVKAGEGSAGTFTIDKMTATGAQALVDEATPDVLLGQVVVLNPTSIPERVPPSQHDVAGKLLWFEEANPHKGQYWEIFIDKGLQHGVRDRMRGHLLINNRRVAEFTVYDVHDERCSARVTLPKDKHTMEKGLPVILNPSK
jgi:hypothetical protein